MNKFLTVIIRVYNRSTTIEECIYSVISQTKINDIQILIIDDCSEDNSVEIINTIIESYPNVNIDLVRHDKNMGRGKALNTAKKYINGEYCCILDSDDIWCNNRYVEILQNNIIGKNYDYVINWPNNTLHVYNVYLSSYFITAPIPNINYHEDHYSKYLYKYAKNIGYNNCIFYKVRTTSADRDNNTYIKYSKFYNNELKNLYSDVFFERENFNDSNLINRLNSFDKSKLCDVLLESYEEIKNELLVKSRIVKKNSR